MTWPIRGCWTTDRHSADVSADGLVEDVLGDRHLADVVEERRDPDPVDLGGRQGEVLRHRDHDRGDQGRRLAAVMRQRRDDRGQAGRRRVAGRLADLDGAGPAGGGDRRSRDAGVLVRLGEDVRLVAPERLRRVHRRVGVAHEGVARQARAGSTGDPDRDRDRQLGVAVDGEALAGDDRAELLGQDGPLFDVRLGEDQHELLAAVAADHVGRAEVRLDHLRDAPQHDVADRRGRRCR